MKSRLGHDFGQVRLHTDARAARSARAVNAKAYTVGNDVVFAEGRYAPHTSAGRALIAHELTHVGQQLSGDPATEDAQEQQAERVEAGSSPVFAPMGAPYTALRRAPEAVVSLTIFIDEADGATFRAELEEGGEFTGVGWARGLDPGEYTITDISGGGESHIWKLGGREVPKTSRFYLPRMERNEAIIRALMLTTSELPLHVIGGQGATSGAGATRRLTEDESTREAVESLPDRVKAVFFSDKGPATNKADYPALLRIGQKLARLSDAELAEYRARTTTRTSDIKSFEKSVDAWIAQLAKRRVTDAQAEEATAAFIGQERLWAVYEQWMVVMVGWSDWGPKIYEWEPLPLSALPSHDDAYGNQMYLDLRRALEPFGYKNLTDYEKAIGRFLLAFREKAVTIGLESLDRYEHILIEQRDHYTKSGASAPLYHRLQPARETFKRAEEFKATALSGGWSPSDIQSSYAAGPEYQRQIAIAEGQVAALADTDPLLANPDFPKQALAEADSDDAGKLMLIYIMEGLKHVENTREEIKDHHEVIYKMDLLVAQTMARLGIKPNSMWTKMVTAHTAPTLDDIFIETMTIALTIALTVLSGGSGLIAAAAFGLSGYQAYQQYQQYAIASDAYGAQLLSTKPWAGWVVLAVVGAAVDFAQVVKVIKPLAPALDAFQKSGDLAELTSKLGGVEEKVQKSILAAAEKEAKGHSAWQGLFPTDAPRGAALLEGTLASQTGGKVVYSVQLNLRRGVKSFNEWARTAEAIDLIGDINKLTPDQIRRVQSLYAHSLADYERIAQQARQLGLGADEVEGFLEGWAKRGSGTTEDALREMAMGNWGHYQQMTDFELFAKYADEGDETAAAVIRQRYPSNDAALRKILGSEYRPPHSARAVLSREGKQVASESLTSGKMTAEEKALGFPKNMLATHTEARAVRQMELKSGDVLEIRGQYDPCGSCQRAMQEAAKRTGATIKYWWQGGSAVYPP
jgi:hypothetical protein